MQASPNSGFFTAYAISSLTTRTRPKFTPPPLKYLTIRMNHHKAVASLITIVCFLYSGSLFAKELKLPNDEFPIASIKIPNSWKPEAVEHGVEAQTEDASFYMSVVAAGTDKGVKADIEGTKDMLKEHKVKIDESTGKDRVRKNEWLLRYGERDDKGKRRRWPSHGHHFGRFRLRITAIVIIDMLDVMWT